MEQKNKKIDRRNFLKGIGAAGLSSAFAYAAVNEPNTIKPACQDITKDPNTTCKTKKPKIPTRKLGKTGIQVPCYSLGTMFNVLDKQIVLQKALSLGVTYWDTAYNYTGGNSELGIGKFLAKNPEIRKKLFIATKASRAKNIAEVEERLRASLKRMNTKYIDLYYGVHDLKSTNQLTNELKQWAQNAKKRGLIRFFGFTTHSNMDEYLMAASKLDWIDAIMTSYNFRLMNDKKMRAAIDVCYKAGIGIIAMKVQGLGLKNIKNPETKKLAEHFLAKGLTEGQAKVKLILEDKRISAVCVGRDRIDHLTQNVAAVLDKTELSQADRNIFTEYAQKTCNGYCAGCSNICSSALGDFPYVSEVMRYLMYNNSYGEHNEAKRLFAKLPQKTRARLLSINYRPAEKLCPQHLPIGKLIHESVTKLT
ncbi:MAG: aldo/keto reductase [Planctomycetota bacterium]|jgi:predicted aldo/keto reductase-like oxidoreductase